MAPHGDKGGGGRITGPPAKERNTSGRKRGKGTNTILRYLREEDENEREKY